MKLSCLPVSLYPEILSGKMSVREWADLAAEAGLDAVDLSVLFFRDRERSDLTGVRRDIEAAGMHVAVLNTYPDFTHPAAGERERQFCRLQADIECAAELGAGMVRVTAGQAYPETGREQGIDWVLDGFRRSCETAGKCGVMLVYENHSQPGIWDYPDFSYSSDVFLDIAGELAGTGMQILFDTANPVSCGDDPLLMLRRVINRVACVHAADTRTEGSMDWVLIGTGSVPFIDIFCMLLENGYDGLVSIEEASRCGREGVERSAEYVRQAWQKACGIVESRTGRTSTKEGGE